MNRFILIFSIMMFFLFGSASYIMSNELYDDSVTTVEGKVLKTDISKKTDAVTRSDLTDFRKRRAQASFQSEPAIAKSAIKMDVEVSSYCLRGFSSRGAPTRVGVIAVDPRVIPFGSRIYVPGYGWGTALDTGSAIRGRTIDIWMPTFSQCMEWGVRNLKISVVKP